MTDNKFFDAYHKNFIRKEKKGSQLKSKRANSPDTDETTKKYKTYFFIISFAFSLMHFIYQILFFHIENGLKVYLYITLGLFGVYLLIILINLILKFGRWYRLNISALTSFSFFLIYVQLAVIIFISFLLKNKSDDQTSQGTISNIFSKFPFDFYLILSGCLAMLSSKLKFLLKNKILIYTYFIVTIVMIVLTTTILKAFLNLLTSLSLCVLLFLICFLLLQTENFLNKKLEESQEESKRMFNNYINMTKALNAGVFLLKNEELFFYNEIGENILANVANLESTQLRCQSGILNNFSPDIRNISNFGDVKISRGDSMLILNSRRYSSYPRQKLPDDKDKEKEKIRFIFKNSWLCENTSDIKEIINKCKNTKMILDSKPKICNSFTPREQIDLSYASNYNSNEERKINLNSIFTFLQSSNSPSHVESNCSCLTRLNEYINLGVFEIEFIKQKKTNYEIILKIESTLSKEVNYEFIFKDVTSQYDLARKIEDDQIILKKNLHEFKTPILSLLGCAFELKTLISSIEDYLPDYERNKIKTYLEHVKNLSNFIGYLIKGLTVSKKEQNPKVIVLTNIKLKSLLKFCFSILQSLLSCDSEKLKNVKTNLKNKIEDYDVSFKSDETQVRQILLNFISNAVKFTNFGKIVMSSKLKKGVRGRLLKIKIKDSGCGVKKQDKSKLFNEYSKLNDTKNNTFGTGLGLNICQTMADNLKMKIKFKSVEKKGTKVTLYVFDPDLKLKRGYPIEKNDMDRSQNSGSFRNISVQNEEKTFHRSLTADNNSKIKLGTIIVRTDVKKFENVVSSKLLRYKTLRVNKSKSFEINEADEREEDGIGKNLSFSNDYGLSHKDTLLSPLNCNLNYSDLPYFSSHNTDRLAIETTTVKSLLTKRLDKGHSYNLSPNKIAFLDNVKENSEEVLLKISEDIKNKIIGLRPTVPTKRKQSLFKINNSSSNSNANKLKRTQTTNDELISRINLSDSLQSIKPIAEKIIIVDDQMHSRKALHNLITLYLKDKVVNYEIIEKTDGVDCLKTVIKNPHTIKYIFIDENMNFMNGTETAEIIRKFSNFGKISQIKLILTSAEDNLNTTTYKKLFDKCVTKPLTQDNIKEVFNSM